MSGSGEDDNKHNHGGQSGNDHDHHHHHHHDHHDHGLGHVHFEFREGEDKLQTLKRIRGAFLLNFTFAIIEIIGGFYTNSISIISNAIHDLGDSLTLATAYVLEKMSYKKSNQTFSYGYRRLSSVSAVMTGLVLMAGSLYVLAQAFPRIFNPEPPKTEGMFILALVGVAVNGLAAYRLSKGASHHERMLVLHLIEDVLGWVLVLIGSILMMFFPWYFLDPLMAVLVSVWILKNVIVQLKTLLRILLQAAPDGIKIENVLSEVRKEIGVQDVHHPHLWTMDGRINIFTAHVVVAAISTTEQIEKIKHGIKHRLVHLGIQEATLEFESSALNCESKDH
ncbi:MAG: cation diffusion facilitator family transporter [Bdellovibrionota bacterium]